MADHRRSRGPRDAARAERPWPVVRARHASPLQEARKGVRRRMVRQSWRRPRWRAFLLGSVAAGGSLAAVFLLGELTLAAWRARLPQPEATRLVRDRDGRFLGELGAHADGELGYWPLASLPPRVVAATIALEDRRFAWHP